MASTRSTPGRWRPDHRQRGRRQALHHNGKCDRAAVHDRRPDPALIRDVGVLETVPRRGGHDAPPGRSPQIHCSELVVAEGSAKAAIKTPLGLGGTKHCTPGGFATTGEPALRLDGTEVVVDESRHVAVAGTFSELADALGVDFGSPPDPYPDGSEASPATTRQWASRRRRLSRNAALRVMAPRQTPILWPEHFDVAILLDQTSYGSSPGDGFHAGPYAYVSSSDHDSSDFWTAPFGAVRSHEQMRSVADLVTFWRKAQSLLKPHG